MVYWCLSFASTMSKFYFYTFSLLDYTLFVWCCQFAWYMFGMCIYIYYTHKVVFSVLVYGSHVSKLAFCAELGVIAGNVIPRDAFKSAARQIQSQRKSQARPRPSVWGHRFHEWFFEREPGRPQMVCLPRLAASQGPVSRKGQLILQRSGAIDYASIVLGDA